MALNRNRSTRRAHSSASRPPMPHLAKVGWVFVIIAAGSFSLREILLLAYTLGIVKW